MKMMDFQKNIEKQFNLNRGKNLFHNDIHNLLKFSNETLKAIEDIDSIEPGSEKFLIDYLTNRALQELCKTNQYYTFNKQAQIELRNLYAELFSTIKKHQLPIDLIAKIHYDNLIKWLKETNSFAEKIYNSKDKLIESVACSEYSPGLQIEILHLNIDQIIEPVLDVGCGSQGSLVLHLREMGIEAYGFDRFAYDTSMAENMFNLGEFQERKQRYSNGELSIQQITSNLITNKNSVLFYSDWFEFEFEKCKWGTIISNLGFSNHFKHHHFRNDGNFIDYAKKYMDILGSLKIGGSFHYAPDLPFVEQYLDENSYQFSKCAIGNYGFNSTIIKRFG